MQPAGAAFGAQCAIHPGVAAPTVCGRCGNFMCLQCSEQRTQAYCPTCLPMMGGGTGFPIGADGNFDQIWAYCFERFKSEWVMLSVGVVLFFGIAMVGGLAANVVSAVLNAVMGIKLDRLNPLEHIDQFVLSTLVSQVVSSLVQIPVMGVALVGLYRMLFDVLEGKKADVARMFSQLSLVPNYVLLQLIIYAVVTLPSMIYFGAVGLVALKSTGVSLRDLSASSFSSAFASALPILFAGGAVFFVVMLFVFPVMLFSVKELILTHCTPVEALRRGWLIGSGQRLRLIGYSFIGGLLMMVGAFACFVGMIPAMALAYLLLLSVYLTARQQHPELPRPV